jgi:hypothetical protein
MSRIRSVTSIAAVFLCLFAIPASAQAEAGEYTDWVKNGKSGCWSRAQAPYLDTSFRVFAYPQVWCPQETLLTVRTRIRSNRTLKSDVTVGYNTCGGSGGCTQYIGAKVLTTFAALCPRTSRSSRHGYHSDIVINPGTTTYSATGATSSAITYTSYCGN